VGVSVQDDVISPAPTPPSKANMDDLELPSISPIIEEDQSAFYNPDRDSSIYKTPSVTSDFSENESEFDTENREARRCSHDIADTGSCDVCNHVVSPPRQRPKGLQRAIEEGIGTGHGRKVEEWCSNREDRDPMDDNLGDVEDEVDDDYKKPRVRRDRKQDEPLPKRVTRSTSAGLFNSLDSGNQ
jgi:hypothetical protein